MALLPARRSARGREVVTILRPNARERLVRAWRVGAKQAPALMDAESGWKPWGGFSGIGAAGRRRVSDFVNAYGGTDESVVWVGACAGKIAERLGAYERRFLDVSTRDPLENEDVEVELRELFDEPNPELTYQDFVEDLALDLELVGNSFWLKDQPNLLGQPAEVRRLPPASMRVATDKQDRKVGYVLQIRGRDIPFGIDDVVHYRYRNPHNAHYGMGTVERIIREVEQELSQTLHVSAFFDNGGVIAGILTAPEFMPEEQFQRLVRQIREAYGDPRNAYRIIIAEGHGGQSPDFKPVTQTPVALGVVELRKLEKDAILSGFGVPAPILGGILENANYKMEEAQHIFQSTMQPKATRYEQRTERDVTKPGWGVGFDVVVTTADPQSVKIERGKNMAGTGATLRMVLEEMGKEVPTELDALADLALLPPNIVPWGANGPLMPTPGTLSVGTTDFANFAALARLGPVIETLTAYFGAEKAELVLDRALGLEPNGGAAREGRRALPFRAAKRDEPALVVAPPLPDGFEQRGAVPVGDAEPANVRALLDAHAGFLRRALGELRAEFRTLFGEQEAHVLERLAAFGSADEIRRARATRLAFPTIDKRQLGPGRLWDDELENERIRRRYLEAVDRLGQDAVAMPARLARAELSWDLRHEHIAAARERIGEQIVRVNDTTRGAIAEQIELGMRRGYSIPQIAYGFPDEAYPGIRGVFQQASDVRADTIARTESAFVYNAASTAAYREAELTHVHVLDGNFDEACARANGERWTLERAEAEPIEHPNCVRAFVPLGVPPVEPAPGRPEPVPLEETPEGMLLPEWAEEAGFRDIYAAIPDEGLANMPRRHELGVSQTEAVETWIERGFLERVEGELVAGPRLREAQGLVMRAGQALDEEIERRLRATPAGQLGARRLELERRKALLEEQRDVLAATKDDVAAQAKLRALEEMGEDVMELARGFAERHPERLERVTSLIDRAAVELSDRDMPRWLDFHKRWRADDAYKRLEDDVMAFVDEIGRINTELGTFERAFVEAHNRVLAEVLGELRPLGIEPQKFVGRIATRLRYGKGTNARARGLLEEAARLFPRKWLERSNARGEIVAKMVERRGWHRFDVWDSEIRVSPRRALIGDDGFPVAIHEYGHRLEGVIDGLSPLQWAFSDYRTRGRSFTGAQEGVRRLADVRRGYGYGRDELTRLDEFAEAYMGKRYGTSPHNPGELVTMALEALFTRSYDLDGEHRRWILGILALL